MDLESLCLEYVNGQSTTESPNVIAKAISDGQVDLVKVVEALEIYLTSTNVDNRSAGTRLLSEVLTQLLPGSLNSDEVHYIVAFYCDRLKDKAVVIPYVLSGIHALVTQYSLIDSDVVAVCRTIFKEVYNQSQQFPERRLVYAIVDHFLTHHLHAIQLMSSDFVLGYIQAIDGERDPRNLLTIFHAVELIVHHLQYETLAEDLFDVTACYFPIDFSPPANDPTAVTKESLVLALRKCLTATEKFAEFCLPLLLDKLTSDLLSAKLDSLSTLATGACVFGASKLHPFLQPFWTTIKREMYQSADEQIQAACVEALTALTKALSHPLQVSATENALDSFIAMVLQDCRRHLCEPELRLITPTIHLLRGIAVSSDPAWTCLASSILPLLIQQASLETQAAKQRVVLKALMVFISAVRQTDGGEVSPPLLSNRDALVELLTSATAHKEYSIRTVAITTLGVLLQIRGALERSKTIQLSERLKEIALSDEDQSVREASCHSLAQLASVDEETVKGHLIPSLLLLMSGSSADASVLLRVVDLLSSLTVVHSSLMELTLPALVEQFGRLLRLDVHLASSITSALVRIANSCLSWEECQMLLADSLLQKMVAACVMSRDVIAPVLEHVVTILSLFTQVVNESLSQNLLTWLVRVLVDGELPASEAASLLPRLGLEAPPTHTQLIALLTGVVGAAPKSVVVDFSDCLLPIMKGLSLKCEHQLTCHYATKCYASLLNKLHQGDALSFLEQELAELWNDLTGEGSALSRPRVLDLWVWVSKALLVRGHPKGMDTAMKLLSVCGSDKDLGAAAADGFAVLMADDEFVLNLKCHANVRLFYKQQLFGCVVPQLVELFKSGQSTDFRRDNLLRALSHLMQGVPKEVLLTELPKVLPLLLESMRSEDVGLKLSSLTAVHSLISDAPQSVVEHVPALVPRLLQLSCDQASMKVRMSSLSCVGDLTTLPTHTVYPYQNTVIQQLAACLDDHKRLVRKEAVDARSKWYHLGTEL